MPTVFVATKIDKVVGLLDFQHKPAYLAIRTRAVDYVAMKPQPLTLILNLDQAGALQQRLARALASAATVVKDCKHN